MDKKMFRSILKLITFTVLLILLIIRFDDAGRILHGIFSLLSPLLAGFGIAFVLYRPFRFFRRVYIKLFHGREGLAGGLAVLSAYLALFAAAAILLAFILPGLIGSVQLFGSNLGEYVQQVQAWINELVARFDLTFLQSVDLTVIGATLRDTLGDISRLLTSAVPQLLTLTTTLVSGAVNAFLALIFSVYMLAGCDALLAQSRRFVEAYLPKRMVQPLLQVVQLSAETFTNFVTGQTIEACILGSLCTIGMLILRFPYAPLIGVIIGVSALIPVVGAFFGAALSALLLAMVNPITALWFLLYIVVLQQIESNLIAPRVVGKAVGLPALWVLAAVVIGSGLFGFVGALVSVPAASVLYTLLRTDVSRRVGGTVD